MKLVCNTGELLKALTLAGRAIGGVQALPILGNVFLKAENGLCTVSATDLEVSITTSIPAEIEIEGAITIPSKAIINFVQYNNDPEIKLEIKEGTRLNCSSKHAKAVIAGEASTEYPSIPAIDGQTTFTLEFAPILRALSLVTFASARTSLRPVLSGVSVKSNDGKLILAATDSYRLSEYKINAPGISDDVACIIPTKILEEVRVVLTGVRGEKDQGGAEKPDSKPITVTLSKQQIEFKVGQTTLLSRLIDGRFPDYTPIIPKECVTKAAFSISELLPAIRRMHYFAKEVNNKLTFAIGKELTSIVTPQTQSGQDEAEILTDVTGEENKIALSSAYLLDLLGHVDGDTLTMEVRDSSHPAIFRLPGEETFLHLIMPLRMTEA